MLSYVKSDIGMKFIIYIPSSVDLNILSNASLIGMYEELKEMTFFRYPAYSVIIPSESKNDSSIATSFSIRLSMF
jgi:hypothetical protein